MPVRSNVPMVSADGIRFEVATGAACIDFVYTGGAGERARWETLHTPRDLAAWACTSGIAAGAEPDDVVVEAGELVLARELREALWQSANRLADGIPLSPEATATVNRAATAADLVPQLVADAEGSRTVTLHRPITGAQVLSALARDAISLATGPYADRVKRCGADDCALLFVDTSRPGARRWCAMSRCGNRNKARTRRRNEGDHASR